LKKGPALLLTGVPGVGKTTVMRRIAEGLSGFKVGGFYTEEMRAKGVRRGFHVITFDGNRGVLADVDLKSPHRVGRYGVDVAGFEAVALPALALRAGIDIYLIDEIGKMECFSQGFIDAVRSLLESDRPVVATVVLRGGGFMAEVKRLTDVEIQEVTRSNRDDLAGRVLSMLRT